MTNVHAFQAISKLAGSRAVEGNLTSILSIAARYPTGPERLTTEDESSTFWQRMCTGSDLVSVVPLERWDIDQHYSPNATSSKL